MFYKNINLSDEEIKIIRTALIRYSMELQKDLDTALMVRKIADSDDNRTIIIDKHYELTIVNDLQNKIY